MKLFSLILFFTLSASVTACDSKPNLNQQEKKNVSELTSNFQTVCAGRYLLNVPEKTLYKSDLLVNNVSITASEMSRQRFLSMMSSLEQQYKNTKHIEGFQFLYESSEPIGDTTKLFIRLENTDSSDIRRVIEAYKWDAGYLIKLESMARDATAAKYENDSLLGGSGTNVPEKKELVLSLLKNSRGRKLNEIPTEAGVCFDGGFLSGKPYELEKTSTLIGLAGKEDVYFHLETDSNFQEKNSMLERSNEIERQTKDSGGKVIRKGKIVINGMSAEEFLTTGITAIEVMGVSFALKINETKGLSLAPFVSLDMETGSINYFSNNKQFSGASLTENEAVALWNEVSKTLRPRPSAF